LKTKYFIFAILANRFSLTFSRSRRVGAYCNL